MQRSLNHLKKRFESAVRMNKPIWVNENDINALNSLIEFANGKPKCSQLEDSLMLFYLLQYWKIANQENKITAKEDPSGIFDTPDAEYVLKRITKLIHPKKWVINKIFEEIRLVQALAKTPKEEKVKRKDVEEYLEKVLDHAKNDFPIARDLHQGFDVVYDYSNKQNEKQ